jgi:hypothetical protein
MLSHVAPHIVGDVLPHPIALGVYTPASGTLFGPNGPSPLDVRQGNVGDCWLIASLAEVASSNPQAITSMFTSLGTVNNGGPVPIQYYGVRFYNPQGAAKTFVVENELPTIARNGMVVYDQPINGVLWVALAEKAYVEAASAGWVVNSITYNAKPCLDTYNDVAGGEPRWAIQAITGERAFENYNSTITEWTAATIIAQLATPGSMVVLGTPMTDTSGLIVQDHAYAVIGYDPTTQLFTLENPWNISQGMNSLYNSGTVREVYGSEFTCSADVINSGAFQTDDWLI